MSIAKFAIHPSEGASEGRKAAMGGLPAAGAVVYVGCRTTAERGGRGTGLSTWRIDAAGVWQQQDLVELTNPSFLTIEPAGRRLYAVHGDGSSASAFALRPDGRPELLGTVGCGGSNPVHLCVLDARTLAVANYASGSVAFLDIADDGSLGEVRDLLELPGEPGPRAEQDGSHPHQVQLSRDRTRLYVPDKGLDTIFEIAVDQSHPRLIGATPARPGSGPRHLVEHPRLPLAYVVDELACTVTTYWTACPGCRRGGDGSQHPDETACLVPLQTAATVPPDTHLSSGTPTTAAAIILSPGARFLYVSNRGQDSVARFKVDIRTGRIDPAGWTRSGGRYPRFMILDPSQTRLLVANERSDSIVPMTVDHTTGDLIAVGPPISTGSPVCIAFPPHR